MTSRERTGPMRPTHLVRKILLLSLPAALLLPGSVAAENDAFPLPEKIVGGTAAAPGEYPWQGSLQVRVSDDLWVHICGAALFTANKALTAAHCLPEPASSYRVVFGENSLSNDEGTEQASSITAFSKHPGYAGNAAGYANDIAVLRLSTFIDTSSVAVSTIPLASGSNDFAGETASLTGWGRLFGGGPTSDILQEVDQTTLTNADCTNRWTGIDGAEINAGHICFFASGKAACSGDSGGPAAIGGVLGGITSWGISSCSGNFPSVYTRVSYYFNWIQSQ